jgi:hypothetical protein
MSGEITGLKVVCLWVATVSTCVFLLKQKINVNEEKKENDVISIQLPYNKKMNCSFK